jgi:hypothetical protein
MIKKNSKLKINSKSTKTNLRRTTDGNDECDATISKQILIYT